MAETATPGELRDIRDVAEVLRQARERGEPASVLIGAGASVTAGIPLATGFVDEVRRRFPNGYARAVEKTYPHVMREINDGERHELISHYVRGARLNWAHVLLGWLVREGFVGRILTTNFDNLAVRCTALYELYPAVYDVTALESFDASLVRDPAVFFLHGQHSGFVQLHTRDEVEENARRLHPVFAEATVRRPWIVLGYSGDNDPVFECLVGVRRFHYGLYWVGFRDNPPNPEVQARLLGRRRQAYWVRGHDADGFMINLFRELGLEMPPLFADPFSHGLSLLEKLAPFPTGIHEGEVDFTAAARSHLAAAKRWFIDGQPPEAVYERHHEQLLVTLQGYFLRGDFDRIITYANDTTPPAKLVPVITAALATRASGTAERVRDAIRLGKPFEGLLSRAIEDLDRVIGLSPEFAEAYCDRASARLMAAEVTRGDAEFDTLVEQARSDLGEALRREPGMYEALHNLAYCDALEAARQQGAARAAHLERAVAGYRRALESTREGLLTHVFLARTLSEFDDRAHMAEAERHLDRAEALDPRHPELLASRLAVGLRSVVYTSLESFAATVRRLTKYADALAELEPETPRGRLFSGFVRLLLAAFTEDPAARSQFDAGMGQFEAARRVMPTPRGAERMLADLEFVVAAALYAEAGHRASPRREELRARADEGFAEAVRRGEDTKHVLRLWGMLMMYQAAEEEARRHELVAVARDKFEAALRLAPDDVATYADWAEGWVGLISESEPGEANARYYGQAIELLRRVSERHGEMAPIIIVWADACRALGQTLADPQHARFLLWDAVTRSSRATELAPETSEAWITYGECAVALAQLLAEDETAEAIDLLHRAAYAFTRAEQLDPGVEPLVYRASALLELAELDHKRSASLLTEAQVLLERAVQRFPDVRELVFLLLELHDLRRDVHAFSVTLRRAAELIPPMTRQEVEQEGFDLLKGPKLPQSLTDALGLLPLAPMSDGTGSADPPG